MECLFISCWTKLLLGRNIRTEKTPVRVREVNSVIYDGLPTHSMFSEEMSEKGAKKWDAPTNEFLINEMTSHCLRGIRVAIPILINFHLSLLLLLMLLLLKTWDWSWILSGLENNFIYWFCFFVCLFLPPTKSSKVLPFFSLSKVKSALGTSNLDRAITICVTLAFGINFLWTAFFSF